MWYCSPDRDDWNDGGIVRETIDSSFVRTRVQPSADDRQRPCLSIDRRGPQFLLCLRVECRDLVFAAADVDARGTVLRICADDAEVKRFRQLPGGGAGFLAFLSKLRNERAGEIAACSDLEFSKQAALITLRSGL